MSAQMTHMAFYAFPVFFAIMWLLVTTMLAVMSGWFNLAFHYPDRPETAIFKLRNQYGAMGLGVNLNGILKLEVCPSGLRVGMWRLFGPFCRDFFVPWSDIHIVRRNRFFWKLADMTFGNPKVGRLKIMSHVADRLAHATPGRWPEVGVFMPETPGQAFRRIALQWLAATVVASAFFTLVPRLASAEGAAYPPMAVTILFPAIVFGIASLFRFLASIRR